jgi:hypothetical protein
LNPSAHLIGEYKVGAPTVPWYGIRIKPEHGVSAGEKVALWSQRVTTSVKTLDKKNFTAIVLLQQDSWHIYINFSGHLHHHVFPGGHVRHIAAVLQLGQPQAPLVLQCDLWALPSCTGHPIIEQVPNGAARWRGFLQVVNVLKQFTQEAGAPLEFALDVMADFDCTNRIGGAQLKQVQGTQLPMMPRIQPIGTVARRHRIDDHTWQTVIPEDGDPSSLVRKSQLQRVERPRSCHVYVGVLILKPSKASI